MVMKSCKGVQCTRPWLTIHPGGRVNNLVDALASRLDAFYANQPKIAYEECLPGYILAKEGAMNVVPYHVPD
jgi:N-acetylglucosamine-6-sulfatase